MCECDKPHYGQIREGRKRSRSGLNWILKIEHGGTSSGIMERPETRGVLCPDNETVFAVLCCTTIMCVCVCVHNFGKHKMQTNDPRGVPSCGDGTEATVDRDKHVRLKGSGM